MDPYVGALYTEEGESGERTYTAVDPGPASALVGALVRTGCRRYRLDFGDRTASLHSSIAATVVVTSAASTEAAVVVLRKEIDELKAHDLELQ